MDKIYLVVSNSDLTEGRGYPVIIYHCGKESTAIRLAQKKGVMGSPANIRSVDIVNVDGVKMVPLSAIQIERPSQDDLNAQQAKDNFTAALKKAKEAGLSDEDIKALGISN